MIPPKGVLWENYTAFHTFFQQNRSSPFDRYGNIFWTNPTKRGVFPLSCVEAGKKKSAAHRTALGILQFIHDRAVFLIGEQAVQHLGQSFGGQMLGKLQPLEQSCPAHTAVRSAGEAVRIEILLCDMAC